MKINTQSRPRANAALNTRNFVLGFLDIAKTTMPFIVRPATSKSFGAFPFFVSENRKRGSPWCFVRNKSVAKKRKSCTSVVGTEPLLDFARTGDLPAQLYLTDSWLIAVDDLAVPPSSVALIGFAAPTGWDADLVTTMDEANDCVIDERVRDQFLADLRNWQHAQRRRELRRTFVMVASSTVSG